MLPLITLIVKIFFFLMIRRPPRSTLFPYTTLFRSQNASTSAGARLEFWKKSLRFVADAPVLGHGTGSIEQQFRASLGSEGPSAIMSNNPHQQTLTVAIQLGLV